MTIYLFQLNDTSQRHISDIVASVQQKKKKKKLISPSSAFAHAHFLLSTLEKHIDEIYL